MNGVVGIDEVGRGCWAGPLLVVAARSVATLPAGLADSKTLSRAKREDLFEKIRASCELGEGWVEPSEIDALGLTNAMKLAVQRALSVLDISMTHKIIMDGSINYCAPQFTNVDCVVKADAEYSIVSAASIYAKVTRDNRMSELAKQYPGYGFEAHVGYGTKQHKTALDQHGLTPLHRLSFKPVAGYV